MIFKDEKKIARNKLSLKRLLFLLVSLWLFISISNAQSTDQNYPTPVTSNEISGTIKARDIGDARLTNYFYTFNGTQGDIFINVQTGNFNGDIDIFTFDGLKLLTKITVYADASDNETGRVVYLRKPEKLLLRIEGRTPNDEKATINIKFAGSFAAVDAAEKNVVPEEPTIKSDQTSDVLVNSVGTIIGVKPKPAPPVKEVPEKSEPEKKADEKTVAENVEPKPETDAPKPKPKPRPKKEVVKPAKSPENTADEPPKPAKEPKKEETTAKKERKKTGENPDVPEQTANTPAPDKPKPPKESKEAREAKKTNKNSSGEESSEAAALANISLKIYFKDGTKIERPMSEILKVGVDKTTLTVITKDGKIGRYSIFDVAKFLIE